MSSASWTARVDLPHGSPWFAGHFPGRPIFPGVAHLAMVDRALRRELGEGWIAGVDPLRVPELAGPGDTLAYEVVRPGEGGRTGFKARRGETVVAEGAVSWRGRLEAGEEEKSWVGRKEPEAAGGPGGVASSPAGIQGPAMRTRVGTAEDSFLTQPSWTQMLSAPRLPHEGPARMAREILDAGPGWIVARAAVDPASAFAEGGRVPSLALLELAAQAAALLEAAGRKAGGEDSVPRIGYLVRVRRAAFDRAWVPSGTDLVARVDFAGGASPLSLYQFSVTLDGATVATGSLGTYLPPG